MNVYIHLNMTCVCVYTHPHMHKHTFPLLKKELKINSFSTLVSIILHIKLTVFHCEAAAMCTANLSACKYWLIKEGTLNFSALLE